MQANRHHGKLQTWQCKVNCTCSSSIARVRFRSRLLDARIATSILHVKDLLLGRKGLHIAWITEPQ